MHHEFLKHFADVNIPHTSSKLYFSHLCGHSGEREIWGPKFLIQTARHAIIDHHYVLYFFHQGEMCETKYFLPAADIVLSPHLQNIFLSLNQNSGSLDLFCTIMKRIPSPVNQGCCPYFTGFLNYSGHLQKWHLYPASQPHHELTAPLCTHFILATKPGSPNRCLAALFMIF